MSHLLLNHVCFKRGSTTFNYNFYLAPGEVIGIEGKNGSGKSTLFELIAGFLSPLSGEILYNKINLHAIPPGKRALAYLFQESVLFDYLTVDQNLALGRTSGCPDDYGAIIDAFRLDSLLGVFPPKLSGGQRQKACLARTLLGRDKLIILDEPFTGIDAEDRKRLLVFLSRYLAQRQASLLFSSHHRQEISMLATRTLQIQVDKGGELAYINDSSSVID